MLPDQLIEVLAAKKSNQLTKKACTRYHDLRLPSCLGIRLFVAKLRSPKRRTLSISFL
jgi:hypothetical protein